MDFNETLSCLLSLIGREVYLEMRAPGGAEIVTMHGVLAAGDDLGAFERSQGKGGPEHDRILFTFREHPFPEGFYLDRRTFRDASWRHGDRETELCLTLEGGVELAVITREV
jgi:hypothetical protein